jgi:hypothetical protein
MALYHSPSIVRTGLVLCLDAANIKSYPGSGTTWFDLSGNNNNATLTGTPTVSNGVFQFNGTTQYANVSSINFTSIPYTIMASARYSGSINGRIITSMNDNWLLGHWSNTTDNYYANGWITAVGAAATTTSWKLYSGTGDIALDQYSLYSGNTQLISNNNGGAAGPNGLSIGRLGTGAGSECSTCEVGFVLAYNLVLSSTEITQNFHALRGRYSL